MSLDLVRIDDRLVHGQVVIGWGTYLKTTKIILCSDPIAHSEIESDMYKGAEETAPHPLSVEIFTQEQTVNELNKNQIKEKIILLVETPQELLQLITSGLSIAKVNIGGMYYKAGKRALAPYIYVDDDDILCFRKILQLGIQLEGKDI
ncbi:PTS sugar transporter subunit IIB, partial [candidate division KSB1 bacterium]|nr:PTS sugar transporter subunit IIB [candidate division KSB1 bacterium]